MTALRSLRPTILDAYVVREVWPPTALGLLLFTFILLLDQISQLMKVLVSKGADLVTVGRAFAYLLPSIFSVTIPMAFLMGVLLAFGRLASDSEIVALRASGISPARLLRPVVALSLATGLLTFWIVAVALPAANQAYREIIFALIVSKARTGVTPRVFNDDLIPGGNMVLYVSDIPAETGEWRDVFIYDTKNPQLPRAILAHAGRLDIDRAKQKVELDLRDGVIYTFNSASPELIDEDRFAVGQFPLAYEEFFPKIPLAKGDREMTLGDLDQQVKELKRQGKGRKEYGRFEVEYHKKFAIPTACLVFGFLGLGLSLGSKKEARSAAFGLSIAVIFIYYVIIRLGEQAGDTGLMPPMLAMWAANIILGAAALVLLWLNHREAAFDPLDPSHYKVLLPRIRTRAISEEASARPRPAGRRVVVLRIPRVSFPAPGLLDRYVARSYLGKFAMVLTAFWALFVLVSFMDLFDDVQHNHVKGSVVVHYYTFSTAEVLHLLTPVAVLVAVLITFGVMARQNEITAIKAAGISVYRAVVPAVVLAAATSLVMFEGAEYLLPPLNKVADRDFNVIKGRPPQASTLNQHRWILGSDGRFYNFDYFQAGDGKSTSTILYGLSVYDVDLKEWRLRDRLYAARAIWDPANQTYSLERGWRRNFGAEGRFDAFHEPRRTREIEPPTYFNKEERAADTMSFGELKRHIASLEALGLDVTKLRVELHRKIAYPAVALVMALLGIPFAFVVARHGALYGVAVSLIIAIVYWAVLGTFDALGINAYLPAALAAWAPNLLFAATGLYFLFTLDT